mgnify:CR=1 FL=1
MPLTAALTTRMRVAPVALGGAPIGNLFSAVADAEAVDVVRHAVQAGIAYFDTAPHYGNGLSERRLMTGMTAFLPARASRTASRPTA